MIAEAADAVSRENIVGYICIALVLITGIVVWGVLVALGKADPPQFMRKKDRVP